MISTTKRGRRQYSRRLSSTGAVISAKARRGRNMTAISGENISSLYDSRTRSVSMTRKLALAAVLCIFALTTYAQTLPQGVRKSASMGGITQYDFSNGLKVLLYPDAA